MAKEITKKKIIKCLKKISTSWMIEQFDVGRPMLVIPGGIETAAKILYDLLNRKDKK